GVVERGRVPGEIGLYNVEIPIHVIVDSGNSHASLRLAIRREGTTRLYRDIYEFPVLLVLIKGARRGIIRDVDIRPAVVIEIRGQHSEPVGAACLQNAGLLGNI